jgi:hypothetical protein
MLQDILYMKQALLRHARLLKIRTARTSRELTVNHASVEEAVCNLRLHEAGITVSRTFVEIRAARTSREPTSHTFVDWLSVNSNP